MCDLHYVPALDECEEHVNDADRSRLLDRARGHPLAASSTRTVSGKSHVVTHFAHLTIAKLEVHRQQYSLRTIRSAESRSACIPSTSLWESLTRGSAEPRQGLALFSGRLRGLEDRRLSRKSGISSDLYHMAFIRRCRSSTQKPRKTIQPMSSST